jgi:multiple sugar transport system permease protein
MLDEAESRLRVLWRTLLLLVITVLFVFPVYWTLSLSVKPRSIMFSLPPKWLYQPIWDHYLSVFADGDFIRPVVNSIVLAVSSTALVVVIGTPAAYSLARLRPRGRDDLMMFVLASRMAPPIALVIPFFLLYRNFGLLQTHLGLVIAYMTFNLSFYVWLLAVFSRDIPHDLEGAGFADGYGPTYVFFRVMLPLMRPSIIATAVLVFIFAWNEFLFALILGGRTAQTLPVAISRFITPSGVQFGPLAALGTVAILPVALLVFALHKHIVRGLSLGAVKG